MDIDIKKYEQLLRASIDAKLSTMDSTFSNSIGLKLSRSKLLIWLNEPSSIILNNDFKAQIEQIITAVLYPYWIVKHKAGLTLVPRWGEPAESARALSYDLHFGIYKRLEVDKLSSTNLFENAKHEVKIALMDDFFWCPDGTSNCPSVPDLAIEAITRNGKTTLLRYLIVNCDGYAKIKVKNGAIVDNFASIIVIDPKLDADLRATTISINGKYIAPDFSKSDINYLDQVNTQLKEIIDLMSPLDLNPFIYRDDVMVASRMYEQMKASSERNSQDVHVAKDISELYETDISKIMFRMPESVMPEAEKLVVNIKDKPYRAFKTQTTMLEFMDARINKGNALVYFCNNNDIPLESVIAFGDMTNDNELLETAGLGVCLCNGNNETKKIANDITEYDNNHDGIGHYLMKHIIEPKGWDK